MNNNDMDIFDKLFLLPVLRVFNPIYKKHKEVFLYLFFGACTTAISIFSFVFFEHIGINVLISNVLSWVLAVSFAYATNRTWVFSSEAKGKALLKEMFLFFTGRLITLLIEEVLLLMFVVIMHFNSAVVKIIAQIVVLILNYVISKIIIFRKGKSDEA